MLHEGHKETAALLNGKGTVIKEDIAAVLQDAIALKSGRKKA